MAEFLRSRSQEASRNQRVGRAVAAISLLASCRANSHPPTPLADPTTALAITTTAPEIFTTVPPTTRVGESQTTTSTSEAPAQVVAVGNVDSSKLYTTATKTHAADKTFTIQRNQETITLPYIRNGSTADTVNSVLGLVACATSVPAEDCIEAFSVDPAAQEELRVFRNMIVPADQIDDPHLQVVFFDKTTDPVKFFDNQADDGTYYISSQKGVLYYTVSTDPTMAWQDPRLRAQPTGTIEIDLALEEAGDGGDYIVSDFQATTHSVNRV